MHGIKGIKGTLKNDIAINSLLHGSLFDTKASRIFKNAMSKVRRGQDKGTWIPPLV